jgi:hypothetical protein
MIPPFDAIRNRDGEPVWIGTERTLEHAKSIGTSGSSDLRIPAASSPFRFGIERSK